MDIELFELSFMLFAYFVFALFKGGGTICRNRATKKLFLSTTHSATTTTDKTGNAHTLNSTEDIQIQEVK